MTPETLAALKKCIVKYQRYSEKTTFDGVRIGPNSCALCQMYNTVDGKQCVGCPVREKTGRRYCHGTPYNDVERSKICENIKNFRAACAAEVAFLESLLLEEHDGHQNRS